MSADSDDNELFRAAVRDVKRHAAVPTPPSKPKPKPRARFTRLDEAAVLEESLRPLPGDTFIENGDEVSFKRAGIADSVVQKLRRGQFRVEAEIDLHGLNVEQAKQALREFLQAMLRERTRCVRIIHGKGRRSGHRGPVLKLTAGVVLRRMDAVVAYCSARAVDGGTGALYVLLRRI